MFGFRIFLQSFFARQSESMDVRVTKERCLVRYRVKYRKKWISDYHTKIFKTSSDQYIKKHLSSQSKTCAQGTLFVQEVASKSTSRVEQRKMFIDQFDDVLFSLHEHKTCKTISWFPWCTRSQIFFRLQCQEITRSLSSAERDEVPSEVSWDHIPFLLSFV